MTLDHLPPQAYTKETLLKAYNWLQNQSENVREMAITPDHLVSLYLKAHRHGVETLERPSLQNFKSELKQLAGMMGDLEKKQGPAPQPVPPAATTGAASQLIPPAAATGTASQLIPPAAATGAAPRQLTAPPPGSQVRMPPPASISAVHLEGLDELTRNMIQEVKSELNLSSDVESLRMLVKIGYQKARTLYK